jgi:hypothetical protein
VEYKLGAVLHTVEGTFALKRGHFSFDPESGRAAGELVVDATSGQSGNGGCRDRRWALHCYRALSDPLREMGNEEPQHVRAGA